MKRKRIADTTTGAVGMLMEALQGPPDAPSGSTLLPCDIPYWDAIVATRPRSEWPKHGVTTSAIRVARPARPAIAPASATRNAGRRGLSPIIAPEAAKAMANVADLQTNMEAAGCFEKSSRGDIQVSPVMVALDSATRRMLSLKRSLGLATDPENTIARTDAYAKSREVAEQLREEPLLAQ